MDDIIAALFSYFRFKAQLNCVTQVRCFYDDIEDFLAFDENKICCVEIKISKQDFLCDFKNKAKHKSENLYDKFYFCVSRDMVDFTLNYLKQNGYNRYGVIYIDKDEVKFAKKALSNALKVDCCYSKILPKLYNRMSSELANEKMAKSSCGKRWVKKIAC